MNDPTPSTYLESLAYEEARADEAARRYADSHDDDPVVEAEFAPPRPHRAIPIDELTAYRMEQAERMDDPPYAFPEEVRV